ncbi:MAG: hypothetical protein J6L77_11430 [Coprococcus sp.]|nr:hypothetical protein [Coprococcus sp.]
MRNRKKSRIKNIGRSLIRNTNAGSIIIEMCFIAPILIGVIFLFISLFMIRMNKGIAMGEAYQSLYTKEAFMIHSGQTYKPDMESELESNANQMMKLAKGITVEIKENRKRNNVIHNLESFHVGEFAIKISYENIMKGVIGQGDHALRDSYEARQEIRDTSNQLRRWQIFGDQLSD